jgi:hypothetical protein
MFNLSLCKKQLKRNCFKSRLTTKVSCHKQLIKIKTYQKLQKLNLVILSLNLKLSIQSLKLSALNPSLNHLLQYLNRNPLTMRSLPRSSTNSWLTRNAPQRRRRRNTCRSCSEIRGSSHTCCTEAQNMGGCTETSTLAVI